MSRLQISIATHNATCVAAWRHIVSLAGLSPDAVFSVSPTAECKEQPFYQLKSLSEDEPPGSATPYFGLVPALSLLRKCASTRLGDDGIRVRQFLGSTPVEVSLINQWVTASYHCAIQKPNSVEAVEDMLVASGTAIAMASDGASCFLTGSPRATVADVLLYAALPHDALLPSRFATVAKWVRRVSSDEYVQPIAQSHTPPLGAAAAAAANPDTPSATAAAGGRVTGGGAAGTQHSAFVKPNAEEIERRRLEKEKAKAEKAAAAEASPAPTAAAKGKASASGSAATVDSIDLDIRVGQITSIARHPDADKLFVETISLGGESRTIVSGLVEHYTAEALHGKSVLVVCNLKPKPLKGVVSHGMVLCASVSGGSAPSLSIVSPPEGTPAGERVSFGGRLRPTFPDVPSNAVTTELLAHLKTDATGAVMWKDQRASVPLGPVMSTLCNAVVK